jgi:hypothetical protein
MLLIVKLNRNRFRLLCWSDRAGEARLDDLLGETVSLNLWQAVEMICTEVFVDGAVTHHMVDRGDDRCGHGADSSCLSFAPLPRRTGPAWFLTTVLPCADGWSAAFQHSRRCAGTTRSKRPNGLRLGSGSCRCRSRRRRLERSDHQARMRAQQADRLAGRVEITIHLRVNLPNGGIERTDLAQMQTQQEAMLAGDPPL